MFAKVSYDDTNGRTKKLQLRAGQRLSIGASFSADIVLGNSQGVAGEHAEIFFKHQKCSIRNLTGKPGKLLVNGQPTKEADLTNGDAIEIGGNQMSIEMESTQISGNATAVSAASVAVAAAAVASTSNDSAEAEPKDTSAESTGPQFERHSNGTAVISVDGFAELIHPVFAGTKAPWNYHLICNHKLSQLKIDPPSGLNYLAAGPVKISDANDLYLTSFQDKNEALPMFSLYGKANACLLGISGPNVDAGPSSGSILNSWRHGLWFPLTLSFTSLTGLRCSWTRFLASLKYWSSLMPTEIRIV